MSAMKYAVKGPEEMKDFQPMLDVLRGTFDNRPGVGRPLLEFGHYANVIDLGGDTALAISTDGVGTKLIVAKEMRDYTTIGIDCIAMNVNDVICVGAEPIALTDYVAVTTLDDGILAELVQGFRKGADASHITIPGGEIAQIPEMVKGVDLVGTCIGLVHRDRLIVGRNMRPGDAIVGFASSGIHSNGLTLARKVLTNGDPRELHREEAELGRTVGAELLEPTTIYVDLADHLKSRVRLRALAHITSDGFLNLRRFESPVGFAIEYLPPTPPIFKMIEQLGGVPATEMYYVYNMGVGLCAIVPESDADAAIATSRSLGIDAWRLGSCVADASKTVDLKPVRLRSRDGHFEQY